MMQIPDSCICIIICQIHYGCIILLKLYIQVNEKGHIGIVEKAKETSLDSGMHNRAITVLHEQWMCPGMQRHTHITLCSMVTI